MPQMGHSLNVHPQTVAPVLSRAHQMVHAEEQLFTLAIVTLFIYILVQRIRVKWK